MPQSFTSFEDTFLFELLYGISNRKFISRKHPDFEASYRRLLPAMFICLKTVTTSMHAFWTEYYAIVQSTARYADIKPLLFVRLVAQLPDGLLMLLLHQNEGRHSGAHSPHVCFHVSPE